MKETSILIIAIYDERGEIIYASKQNINPGLEVKRQNKTTDKEQTTNKRQILTRTN